MSGYLDRYLSQVQGPLGKVCSTDTGRQCSRQCEWPPSNQAAHNVVLTGTSCNEDVLEAHTMQTRPTRAGGGGGGGPRTQTVGEGLSASPHVLGYGRRAESAASTICYFSPEDPEARPAQRKT